MRQGGFIINRDFLLNTLKCKSHMFTVLKKSFLNMIHDVVRHDYRIIFRSKCKNVIPNQLSEKVSKKKKIN